MSELGHVPPYRRVGPPQKAEWLRTYSLRRTKATPIYQRGNLRAVQLLLGHTKIGTVSKDYFITRFQWYTRSQFYSVWRATYVMYGRPPLGKGFLGVSANESGSGHVYGLEKRPLTAGPDGARIEFQSLRRAVTRDDEAEYFDPGFLTICHHTLIALPIGMSASAAAVALQLGSSRSRSAGGQTSRSLRMSAKGLPSVLISLPFRPWHGPAENSTSPPNSSRVGMPAHFQVDANDGSEQRRGKAQSNGSQIRRRSPHCETGTGGCKLHRQPLDDGRSRSTRAYYRRRGDGTGSACRTDHQCPSAGRAGDR
jgi:hypothetical protein